MTRRVQRIVNKKDVVITDNVIWFPFKKSIPVKNGETVRLKIIVRGANEQSMDCS